ncbi:MAG TPA: DNA helicase RecQ [Veillonellaceae bacterium]|nr:DNA helicase RecQ [Veillonellaceae bacterium]
MTPSDILKNCFGYDSFRPVQEKIIQSILAGHDVLAVMPTGAGKSICFQVPALMFPFGTVIISPLISLMKDQVEALSAQGIPASFVNSTISREEAIQRLRELYTGRLKLLYMAPEKLEPSYFTECLRQVPLSMVVIDEAHCVSQWGHDFRPSYCRIHSFLEGLPERPVIGAFTATATPAVAEDIKSSLGLAEADEFRTGLDRPNLSFRVIHDVDKKKLILRYVKTHRQESGIIYCATRKAVDEVYALLMQAGIAAGRYHAGMDDNERRQAQEDFSYDRVPVMAATNAFGMGIDKSNVRYVIHYQMPRSLEAYYQEAGRAGRDGASAECLLLYHGQDPVIQRYLIEKSELPEEQERLEYERLNRMLDYCQTSSCLRNFILTYFGEHPKEPCGHCGNCETAAGRVRMTDTAGLVFRTVVSAGERFGVSVIADILKGSRSKKIQDMGLQTIPTYGKLGKEKLPHIKSLIHQYIADGYLLRQGDPYPVLKLCGKSREVLEGKAEVYGFAPGAEEVIADTAVERTGTALKAAEQGLFEALRKLRLQIASEEKVPPFVIFSDATLEEMADSKPDTEQELSRIKGVGTFKLQKYGLRFLKEISSFGKNQGQKKKDISEKEENVFPIQGNGMNESSGENLEEENFLYHFLCRIRKETAAREGVLPYRVFSDAVLHDMAHIRPRSQEAMMGIRGIGPARWERYGSFFLKALAEAEKEEKEAICQTEHFTSGAFLLYLEHVRTQIACTEGISPDEVCSPKILEKLAAEPDGREDEIAGQSKSPVSQSFLQAVREYRKNRDDAEEITTAKRRKHFI